jgi:hypothetical protein
MSNLERADIPGKPPAEPRQASWRDPRIRNRQWAVTFLVAATNAEDAVERNGLRRRAAELILPRRLAAACCRDERAAC